MWISYLIKLDQLTKTTLEKKEKPITSWKEILWASTTYFFKLIIQSILFYYEALIVPLFFRIKQQPWFGWENSLFSHSSYKFVLSTGCWAATNTWETNIWWLYIHWFNSIPECQGRTVECLVRMCCDIILVLHILTQTIEKNPKKITCFVWNPLQYRQVS